MTLSRLRSGEWLAAVGGVLALVSLFVLHWYVRGASFWSRGGRRGDVFGLRFGAATGWDAIPTLRWFVLVTAVLGLLLALAQAASRGPALPVTLDLVSMLIAGVTTILVAIRLATTSTPLRFGAVAGVFAEALVTTGAYQALRAEQGWTPGAEREVELVELSSESP